MKKILLTLLGGIIAACSPQPAYAAGPQIAGDGVWSLGVLIGLPLGVLIVVLLLGLTVWMAYENEIRLSLSMLALAAGGVIMIGWAMYPYSNEYHQFRAVSGTVERIDKRLISSGDSMQDKFVVRFEGSDLQFGCDDTRCSQVDPGDALELSCKREWQYTGTDGYNCRFTSTAPAR